MDGTTLFLLTDLMAVLALAAYKTIYFMRATRRRSFLRWLYFTRFDIINSMSSSAQREKKRQNGLSAALLVAFILSLITFYFLVKYKSSFAI